MKHKVILLIITGLCLSGCAVAAKPCLRDRSLETKTYIEATQASKEKLHSDLKSGVLKIDAVFNDIRSTYGNPDNMLVTECAIRVIYKLDSGDNITLWFEDGMHLSMWSN